MADRRPLSDSEQRAMGGLPAKVELPQITGLSTAFPLEVESQPEPSPSRKGKGREPRRHESGR